MVARTIELSELCTIASPNSIVWKLVSTGIGTAMAYLKVAPNPMSGPAKFRSRVLPLSPVNL
jgi:hypothetical protein